MLAIKNLFGIVGTNTLDNERIMLFKMDTYFPNSFSDKVIALKYTLIYPILFFCIAYSNPF